MVYIRNSGVYDFLLHILSMVDVVTDDLYQKCIGIFLEILYLYYIHVAEDIYMTVVANW